ncbi:hypothetical protein P7L95_10365 [Bisgaard Taxon 10/6]|uniref:hypothetical protein n=1 Tax=Exercitatus varius TaxID=67857 RepID=UPI00294B4A16|nr:hypothetical protein [Exercitatus varius]MDG2957145.1 hypothetical protein [Exercitatus varius]MDG2965414.1 hypothetical protein [Exercitatus varius]
MEIFSVQKNQIFNNLLHLSGLSNDLEAAIELMRIAGYEVSLNQLRSWRRSKEARNYQPVPSYALQIVFDYLFEMKRHNTEAFLIAINDGLEKVKVRKAEFEYKNI